MYFILILDPKSVETIFLNNRKIIINFIGCDDKWSLRKKRKVHTKGFMGGLTYLGFV